MTHGILKVYNHACRPVNWYYTGRTRTDRFSVAGCGLFTGFSREFSRGIASGVQTVDMVLQINNLWCERDGKTVLSDVSLSTDARRIGLVGRNGSGKSSLARLIVGLEAPSSGSIRVLGGEVASDRAFALNTVGMIFQSPEQQIIFPTVFEEIGFGLVNLGLPRSDIHDRVAAILERFGWQGWQEKSVHTLSHGQKHLLCLMAVLVMEPGLIVFDEPYASLDIPTAAHMRSLVSGLSQCVIMISHTTTDFQGFEELIWLEEGLLKGHGPVECVLLAYLEAMAEVSAL